MRPFALSSILWSVLLLAPLAALVAQENEDCLACHSDTELTGTREGQPISVFVDEEAYASSVHGDLECVLCHEQMMGDPMHDESIESEVDCGNCHDGPVDEMKNARHGRLRAGADGNAPGCDDCHGRHDIQYVAESEPRCESCHAGIARDQRRSLHGEAAKRGDKLAPTCSTCHGSHNIPPADDPDSPTAVMNVPVLCGRCHREGSEVSETHEIAQDHILQNYSMSIHGEGLYNQGLTVTAVCSSCHTAHNIRPHTDPQSSIHRDNIAATCSRCHGQIEAVHRKVIEGRLWEEEPHKIPACVDCHSPHEIRRVFYDAGLANQDCLRCHSDAELTMEREGEVVSLYVDPVDYAASAHSGTACAQCHTDVTPSLTRACETVNSKVDCSVCHADQVHMFEEGMHGELIARGDPDAPTCVDCHTKHRILSKNVPASPTFVSNVPYLCATCHKEGGSAAARILEGPHDIVHSYIDSIHGKGLIESGLLVTATCADCHTAHRALPAADPRSSVNPLHVAETCGLCHRGIEERFRKSVHSPEVTETDEKLPTCATCHMSHTIERTDRIDFRFHMMDQCGQCHVEEAETFFDTFHGKVSRLGSAGAAKCYDCHGTHNILPASNPASTLGRDNVVETCGKCHAGSHRQFAGYLTHATHHDRKKYPWLFYSFWFMTILLVGTLTFALMHTLAWLTRLFLSRDEWKAHKQLSKTDHKPLYRRFTRYNRILHGLMVVSFFALSITGMALKFSYMRWAQWVASSLGGFEVTGTIHRLGAFLLFVVFFGHLISVVRRKRSTGKGWLKTIYGADTILFSWRDLKEFVQSIRLWPLHLLGEVRLLCRALGDHHHRRYWLRALVPRVFHSNPSGLVDQRGDDHP
ncbi:MAG: cytochrome c3 family protein [Acidobacteriota bacterium]